jgi:hypothetical protein
MQMKQLQSNSTQAVGAGEGEAPSTTIQACMAQV